MSKQIRNTMETRIKTKAMFIIFAISLALGLTGIFTTSAAAANNVETVPAATITRELTNKRDNYTKYFLLSDGSYRAITYATPVHFKKSTSNGKVMQEIDTTLINSNSNKQVKVTKSSQSTTQIAKNSKYKKTVSIKRGSTLSWKLTNEKQKNKKAIFRNPKKQDITSVRTMNTVTYKNILTNIDLQYNIQQDKITEDIIIRKKSKIPSFTYDYSYGKMKVQAKGGRIQFKVGSKVRFERQKVVVSDALGASTKKVKVTFKKGKLTITPDKKWMNDKKRRYPIVIRSTTLSSYYKENIHVAGAYAGTPDQNHSFLPYLQLEANKCIAFTKVAKRPTLGAGARIRTAGLTINNLEAIKIQANKTFGVDIHRVTQKWKPSKVTNNNRPTYDKAINAQLALVKAGRYKVDITDIVKDWYTGTPNYGVALVAANANGSHLAKLSKEPTFTIDYELPNFTNATQLIEDKPLQRSVRVSGQEDGYYFTTQPGIAYDLYTTSNLDTQGLLYDASYNRIAYNDNGGENLNFRIVSSYDKKTYLKVNTKGSQMGNYTVTLKRRFKVPVLTGEQKSGNEFLLKWNAIENAKEYLVTVSDKAGKIDTIVVTGTTYLYNYTRETKDKILSFTVQPRESQDIYGEASNRVLSQITQSEWDYQTSVPMSLRSFGAVSVGTNIYIAGGYQEGNATNQNKDIANKDLLRYDTSKDKWETITTCPFITGFLVEPSLVELNGRLYVIGGYNGTGKNATVSTVTYAYDLSAGTWNRCANLPMTDGETVAIAFDGKIICFSKPNGGGTIATYDPRINSWQSDTHNLRNSGAHLVTVVDHVILVLKEGKGELYFQEYDPTKEDDPWGDKGTTKVTNSTYTSIGTESGTMYLQENGSNKVIYYDFYRDNWGEINAMNMPKSNAKLLSVGESLYSIGGTSEGFGTLNIVEHYLAPGVDIQWEDLAVTKDEVYELQLGTQQDLPSGEITLKYDPEYLEIQKSSSFLLLEEASSDTKDIQITKYDPDKGIIRFRYNIDVDGYFNGVHHSIPFTGLGYGKTRVSMYVDNK